MLRMGKKMLAFNELKEKILGCDYVGDGDVPPMTSRRQFVIDIPVQSGSSVFVMGGVVRLAFSNAEIEVVLNWLETLAEAKRD
jgi:hypothetical protein